MSLPNNTRMRLLSFGIVVCLILTVVGGGTALGDDDDIHAASALPVSTSLTPSNQQAMPTNCLPDSNEPNDNPAQATPLGSDVLEANFHTPGDVDWYRYNSTGGTWHRERYSEYDLPYVVEVYNESTGQLVTNGLSHKGFSSLRYAILVSWYAPSNASYLIKVAYPTQAAGLHTCGSSKYYFGIGPVNYVPEVGTHQIKGLIYQDSNWSGDWQIEESVIEGAVVRLLRPDGAVVAVQSSGSNGVFHFAELPGGSYFVEQTDLDGYVSTTPNRVIVNLVVDKVMYFGDYYLPTRGSLQFLPMQLKQR